MWRCPSFFLVSTSLFWLTVLPSHVNVLASILPTAQTELAQGGSDGLQSTPTLTPIPTSTPVSSIENQPILRLGDSGELVKQLQTQLQQIGYYSGKIDGEYGVSTRLAVAKLQAAKGLTSDGVVGLTTRMQIEAEMRSRAALADSTSSSGRQEKNKSSGRGTLWWMFAGMGLLGCGGAVAFSVRKLMPKKPVSDPTVIIPNEVTAIGTDAGVEGSPNSWQMSGDNINFRNITTEAIAEVNQNSLKLLPQQTSNTIPSSENSPSHPTLIPSDRDQTFIQSDIQPHSQSHYITAINNEQTWIQSDRDENIIPDHEQTFIQADAYYSSIPDHEQTFIQADAYSASIPNHEQTFIQTSETDLDDEPWEHHAASQTIRDANQNIQSSQQIVSSEMSGRLAKVNIIDELVKDLRSADPTKRRKAVWDLGQQGDSRAIQPLVDLLIDADSQQRSLILGALSEIGTRTLKPMNRALAISLQDESPEVRQNAIRDLTRVYDLMAQLSQMLCHAAEDPDPNVQATARYALTQFNRLRTLANSDKE